LGGLNVPQAIPNLSLARFLLLGDDRVEHSLLDIRLEIAFGIDKRIPTAASKLRVLLFHAVLRGVIAELNVARQGADQFE